MSAAPRVGVVGLGAIGLMTALALQRRGANVVGYERARIGHPGGASAGETRLHRVVYAEGAEYVPMLERSAELWSELEAHLGRTVVDRTGAVAIAPTGSPVLTSLVETAQLHGLPHELIPAADFRRHHPQFLLGDGDTCLVDAGGALLHVDNTFAAARSLAEQFGAQLHEHAAVTSITTTAAGVEVSWGSTTDGLDAVVVATGAWARELVPDVAIEARMISVVWFPLAEPLTDAQRFPPIMRYGDDGLAFTARPSIDGRLVMFGLNAAERLAADMADPSPTVPDAEIAALVDRLHRTTRGIHDVPAVAHAHPEAYSPDGHLIIAPVPGASRVVIAAGGSAHSFKLSPAYGERIADIVLRTTTSGSPAPADPPSQPT
ncbi:MAG: FAD-dependent oxidoreductase [Ilumatobacteraceae bacterium]